jgi:hypothetical protein
LGSTATNKMLHHQLVPLSQTLYAVSLLIIGLEHLDSARDHRRIKCQEKLTQLVAVRVAAGPETRRAVESSVGYGCGSLVGSSGRHGDD